MTGTSHDLLEPAGGGDHDERERVGVERNGREVEHDTGAVRSEEHTSELQSLMRISYAVFCLKKKKYTKTQTKDKKKQTEMQTREQKDINDTTQLQEQKNRTKMMDRT